MNWNLSIVSDIGLDRSHIVAESGNDAFRVTVNGILNKDKLSSALRHLADIVDGTRKADMRFSRRQVVHNEFVGSAQ